jgi:hypothetical protein
MELVAVSAWLWQRVVEPTLAIAGLRATGDTPVPAQATDLPLPRIRWLDTGGPLTGLPLHVAGQPGPAGATMLDHAVGGYLNSLHDLAWPHDLPSPNEHSLVVINAEPVAGLPALDVAAEGTAAAARLPDPVELDAAHADSARILAELGASDYFHFAGHSDNRKAVLPADRGLLVADGRLTVRQIATLPCHTATLAYLSACQTATAADRRSLAAAFQSAGYRNVVATRWDVADTHAAAIAGSFYEHLLPGGAGPRGAAGGVVDGDRVARAVHFALRACRDMYPDRPDAWSAHIHFGP